MRAVLKILSKWDWKWCGETMTFKEVMNYVLTANKEVKSIRAEIGNKNNYLEQGLQEGGENLFITRHFLCT